MPFVGIRNRSTAAMNTRGGGKRHVTVTQEFLRKKTMRAKEHVRVEEVQTTYIYTICTLYIYI